MGAANQPKFEYIVTSLEANRKRQHSLFNVRNGSKQKVPCFGLTFVIIVKYFVLSTVTHTVCDSSAIKEKSFMAIVKGQQLSL